MKYQFELLENSVCYQGFFRLERWRLRHELFAGGSTGDVVREVFQRGHAGAVLLYDPDLDSVVLVEQFRVGSVDAPRGPWELEIVAGIIEEGEDPEAVVRRESVEEAGCEIGELVPVAEFALSPGGSTERMHIFCARVDASSAGGIYGLAHEHEDIRVRVFTFDEAYALLQSGKIASATPIIAIQWLALNRDKLRARWSGG